MLAIATKTTDWENGVHLVLRSKRKAISNRLPALEEASDRVKQPEDHRRTMIDEIPALAWSCGTDGAIDFLNQRWLDFTGLSMEQAFGWGWKAAIHPDDLDQLMDGWLDVLASQEPLQKEARLRRYDGEYRWFLFCAMPVRNQFGEVIKWYGSNTDIEDLKRSEAELLRDELEHRNANLVLREEVDSTPMFAEIVGASKALRNVLWQVSRVAPMDSTVLILGETGTGKELIARAIHRRSSRSTRPFISVNCAAIPPSLIASELFGHEKGAFTSAMQRHLGRFELANGGTIFLDGIGELQMDTQIALLRVLQEREFERIGGNHLISVDVRVLAATNRDLKAAVAGGTFREDLFYRLNVFPVQMPPLHERKDDIRSLVEYFVDRYSKQAGKKIKKIDKKTLELFEAYKWPGNIRELQNLVERGVILCDGETFTIDESWLMSESPSRSRLQSLTARRLLRGVEDQQRELIETALAESGGRVGGPSGAAKKLGIPRQTLESKIIALGINKHLFKLTRLPLSSA
jgi:PAS domain S-box-containing protein